MSVTATSRNFNWVRYVSDLAINFAVKIDAVWGASASSGFAAFNAADAVFGRQTRRRRMRFVIYTDAVTFRSVKLPFGTVAAYNAAPATVTIKVPGASTGVVYTRGKFSGEQMPPIKAVRQATEEVLVA